jgi:hypothetical protein
MRHRLLMCALFVSSLAAASAFAADAPDAAKAAPSPKEQIQTALKAGPASITAHAAVKDMSGKVLRAGNNGWTCYAQPEAMCLDAVWEGWMQAYMKKGPFHTDKVGTAYMLAGDNGTSNTDPFATAPTADNHWVQEGPHIMVLFPDAAMLEAFSSDENNGGPYVMWKGTPYQHVMIPVGKRPKKM